MNLMFTYAEEVNCLSEKDSVAIKLNNINYGTKNVEILKGITGNIYKGKITTLVGPSGSGKSTLFSLLNGMRSPQTGTIIINGKNINEFDPLQLRREVGIVLQKAVMINGDVFKNLSLPLSLQGKTLAKDKAIEYLKLIGLNESFLHRQAADLSGGQQQRISIARSLINEPPILLLDEITSSLDQASQHEIEQLISNVNKEFATTIIWITHNLQQAVTIGHDTWVMVDGKLVESGSSNLLENPKSDEVKQFLKGGDQ